MYADIEHVKIKEHTHEVETFKQMLEEYENYKRGYESAIDYPPKLKSNIYVKFSD